MKTCMNNVIRLEGDRENLLGLWRLFCWKNKMKIRFMVSKKWLCSCLSKVKIKLLALNYVRLFSYKSYFLIRFLTRIFMRLTLLKTLFTPYSNNKTTLVAQRYNPLSQTLLPYFQYIINPAQTSPIRVICVQKTKN